MFVSDIKSMRRLDELAVADGTPSLTLMERAATGIAEQVVLAVIGRNLKRSVIVFCGKGNNGGDGLAASVLLTESGFDVTAILTVEGSSLNGDALYQLNRVKRTPAVKIINGWNKGNINSSDYGVVIDAIFGTGFTGTPSETHVDIIRWINSSSLYVISADTPSGINCDTGEVPCEAVNANITVTFGLPKIGQMFLPAKNHIGLMKVHDIGLPEKEVKALCGKTVLIDRDIANNGIKNRLGNEHKNKVGRVLVIAGSIGMTGAAVLTAKAALHSGAGIVTLLVPESLNTIFEIKLTEEMTIPLHDGSRGFFTSNNIEAAKEIVSNYDVVAIGPGLGRNEETVRFIKELLLTPSIKGAVIDADALYAFGNDIESISNLNYPVVVTPHEGEFSRLISTSQIPSNGYERVTFLRKSAKKFKKTVIVLKGAPSLVCCDAEEVYINTTGNAGMATAGSGDVLTGITAALLAQNKNASAAAITAVYLHGLSGDIAKEKLTEYAMTSGDLIKFLPEAFKECIKENNE